MYFQDGYKEIAFAEIALKNIDTLANQIREICVQKPEAKWYEESLTNFELLEKFLDDKDSVDSLDFRSGFPQNLPTQKIISACQSSLKKLKSIALAGEKKLRNNLDDFAVTFV